MVQLQCPICRTIVGQGTPTFPQCPKCGEYLIKCRYCRALDRRSWECTDALVPPSRVGEATTTRVVGEPNAIISCPRYDSRLLVVAQPRQRLRHLAHTVLFGAPLLGLSLLTILFGARLLSWSVERRGAPEVKLGVSCPDETEAGTSFTMRLRVMNGDRWNKRAVVIRLPERFFESFPLVGMTPRPDDTYVSGGSRCFRYDDVPARSELDIEMRLVPRRVGLRGAELTLHGPDGTIFARKRLQLTTF